MAKRKPGSKRSARRPAASKASTPRGRKYTPVELFMAAVGLAVLVLVVGMVISAIFG